MNPHDQMASLQAFLDKAKNDGKEKRKNYSGKEPDHPDEVIVAVDDAFEKIKDDREHTPFPPEKPWELTDKQVDELLELTKWVKEHDIVTGSPPLDQIYVLVRYAMPLHATTESEDGAAG
jgi:hypothetical protein